MSSQHPHQLYHISFLFYHMFYVFYKCCTQTFLMCGIKTIRISTFEFWKTTFKHYKNCSKCKRAIKYQIIFKIQILRLIYPVWWISDCFKMAKHKNSSSRAVLFLSKVLFINSMLEPIANQKYSVKATIAHKSQGIISLQSSASISTIWQFKVHLTQRVSAHITCQ